MLKYVVWLDWHQNWSCQSCLRSLWISALSHPSSSQYSVFLSAYRRIFVYHRIAFTHSDSISKSLAYEVESWLCCSSLCADRWPAHFWSLSFASWFQGPFTRFDLLLCSSGHSAWNSWICHDVIVEFSCSRMIGYWSSFVVLVFLPRQIHLWKHPHWTARTWESVAGCPLFDWISYSIDCPCSWAATSFFGFVWSWTSYVMVASGLLKMPLPGHPSFLRYHWSFGFVA